MGTLAATGRPGRAALPFGERRSLPPQPDRRCDTPAIRGFTFDVPCKAKEALP